MTRIRDLARASVATAAVLTSAQHARAQSFTIPAGTTETVGQVLGGNGAIGIVAPGGTILTFSNNEHGIAATGAFATIVNGGTISTIRGGAFGIDSQGAFATIRNSGTISTAGFQAYGIRSTGANTTIANSGSIATAGPISYGIASNGTNITIINSGTISTVAASAFAIESQGDFATITNSGTISTAGLDADAIVSVGAGATIRNNGTIRTSGAEADGIWSSGANATIVNGGAVLATGDDGHSIIVRGANSSLTLLRGSVLQGDLWVLLPAANIRLSIAPGLSAALRFDLTDLAGVPGVMPTSIDAGGMPLAVNAASGLLATADVSALRGQSQMLGDLTGGIFAAVDGRRGPGAAAVPVAYAAETGTDAAARTAFAADFRKDEARYERTIWLKGFGATRSENGSGSSVDQDQRLAGAVSGVDLLASASGKAGLFFGGAFGRTDVPQSQEITATSAIGGAYATAWFGSATLDLALAFGWTRYDSSRRVADNAVAGGIANATADYDGVFIAPRIALTQPFLIGAQVFEAKLSGHYAGLFLDGFTETGSIGALSVNKRDLHLFIGRAGLSMPLEQGWSYGLTRVIPTIGIEGRVQTGDTLVNGTLIGTGIVFDAGANDILSGFGSLRIEHDMSARLALFAEAEALFENTGSSRILAAGGLKLRF
ncbi:autotransporter domain-containing protein [Bradyrhizobium sp. 190]|uniref:autotransporter outer membrane beta-barrel domain-containing protein n=1 Tax=Bradyrhizobium sp. 190 TaxID=2782658 RepID=UPI001FFA0D57|nr:autotransporter domain-containing protein [Bradyrhizobium sp. 190]MCK1512763.1 autotransporter domain-containing protein [Bradyrhizobium sp. 190]